MPGGRPGPALFELLRDKTGTRADTPARPLTSAPPPAPAPLPPPAPLAPPIAGIDLKQRISLTMSTVWIGVGIAILVIIGIYSMVYKVAYNRGEREATRDISKGSGPITEPLHSDAPIPVNPTLVSQPPKQSPLPPPTTTTGTTPNAPAGDPRIAGFNYLTIASKMDRETADRAVDFLTKNDVQSFAVAVVKGGSGANNTTYTVYALLGITREQLRANAPVKTELQDRVTRLGKIWQKEHKGQTDFSRWYWDKFGS